MKNKYLLFISALFLMITMPFVTTSTSGIDKNKNAKAKLRKPDIVDLVFVKYNNWSYVMRNNGSYMYDSPDLDGNGNNAGGEFPRGSGNTIVYASGLYIGALKNGIPVVSEARWSTEFQPGRITNSGVPFSQLKAEDPLSPLQQVYLIDRSKTGDDYRNWPTDALRDSKGDPALIADAQTWAVFNDLDTALIPDWDAPDNLMGGLGLQITLESFVNNLPAIGNSVFLKFTVSNKTNTDYNGAYMAIWMDPDVGFHSTNDIGGCDTVSQIAFFYDSDAGPAWGSAGAVAIQWLQGPVVNSNEIPAKEAVKCQNNKTVMAYDPFSNHYNLNALDADQVTLDPTSLTIHDEQSGNTIFYRFMAGLDWNGQPRWGSGANDYYNFRGNPLGPNAATDPDVSHGNGSDIKITYAAGPFIFKTNSTQELWVAIAGGISENRLSALANALQNAAAARNNFRAGFAAPSAPPRPNLSVTASDNRVVLTWEDNAESYSDSSGERLGVSLANGFSADYVINDFQGYRVYRSLTGLHDSYELLAQYDKIDSLGSVINRYLNENNHLEIKEIHLGDNTGLQYAYTDSGLVNGQNYYYSVTAYDAQPYIAGPDTMIYEGVPILRPAGLPVTLESSLLANAVSAVPAKAAVNSTLKNIKVVPNPFYKYSAYESNFDKLIKFTNLPEVCTIRIFNVAGDLVKTIKHNSTSNNDRVNNRPYDEEYEPGASSTSIEHWDLKTANGRYVASGMYIALVESPAGKRFVKFAVIQ